MYGLKRVYATLSFECDRIDLLVVEHDRNNKINCLFHDYFVIDYLDNNFMFKNYDGLIYKLKNLINSADKFIGISIKRYIVNIAHLSYEIVNKCSPEFIVLRHLTQVDETHYIEKVLHSDNSESKILKIYVRD